ncbi:MAG: DUF362 domain-containing protein [Planctomycetales bacterium]
MTDQAKPDDQDKPSETNSGDANSGDANSDQAQPTEQVSRRNFLIGANVVVIGGIGAVLGGKALWDRHERGGKAEVFIGKAEDYQADLVSLILDGFRELKLDKKRIEGKTVLLKPNLVEPSKEAPHINTHPLMVRAAAEAFAKWGAGEVLVAEGQGHLRDTYLVLEQSGLGPVLDDAGIEFIDLNHDDVFTRENQLGFTDMKQLWLPQTLKRADFIVSLPKMKTHHWAGATLSMKNFFGVMPGVCYGWPKNVLHHAGIGQSILDINAAVKPDLAIVDGIIGMEGDGPIMGTPKQAGVVVMGESLPATDATAVRVMGLDPWNIAYLRFASGYIGPVLEHNITQRGEPIADVVTPFALLNHPDHSPYPT